MICFECGNECDRGFTIFNGALIHWQCAREILQAYYNDKQDRERHIDQQAEAEILADRLGYKQRCLHPGTFRGETCSHCNEPVI